MTIMEIMTSVVEVKRELRDWRPARQSFTKYYYFFDIFLTLSYLETYGDDDGTLCIIKSFGNFRKSIVSLGTNLVLA